MKVDDLTIKKASQGDKDAFRIIVDKYKNLIFAVCKNIVADSHEAENLTQETFIKVYKSLSQYRYSGFKTWITRIAVNKCIDYKRRLKRKREKEMEYFEEFELLSYNEPSAQDIFIKREENQQIRDCCSKLPYKYADVIDKYYIQNKSCREIAEEEKISARTVETRLYRGRKLLKNMLEEVF